MTAKIIIYDDRTVGISIDAGVVRCVDQVLVGDVTIGVSYTLYYRNPCSTPSVDCSLVHTNMHADKQRRKHMNMHRISPSLTHIHINLSVGAYIYNITFLKRFSMASNKYRHSSE